ncbi:MAG: hypothetical protein ABR999_02630 [Methanoregula sp.]|jgi:hypothetical protein|uniref:hypothetical protein n=1 Tax=Methanoregula sp. TaxID=2052170 RepID=UPI003D09D1E1
MTKQICLIILVVITILMLLVTGCVTPPKGTTTSSTSSGYYATGTHASETTAPPAYVTEVTPYTKSSQDNQTHTSDINMYATPTPFPQDLSCLIYTNTQYYSYNTTAVTFDLKNPPMYINYTVKPFNITVNKVVSSKAANHQLGDVQTITFSDYAPYSWFDITVRDKSTGEIYLQDGFGQAKGYEIYTNAILKPILKTDDLQIEMRGNNITATTGIWVKPVGNFEDPQNKSFAECKYWGQIQNSLPVVTATATTTWTPENQVTE